LANRLEWDVTDPDLLLRALSHRSWCAETPGAQSNERLEFLGDAVLGLVVTDYLFLTYPTLPEGELAKVRASVVNSSVLAELAGRVVEHGDPRPCGGEDRTLLATAGDRLRRGVEVSVVPGGRRAESA